MLAEITDLSVLSVLFYRFSVFVGFLKTDVGSVFGFLKTAVSVRFSVNRPNTSLHYQMFPANQSWYETLSIKDRLNDNLCAN